MKILILTAGLFLFVGCTTVDQGPKKSLWNYKELLQVKTILDAEMYIKKSEINFDRCTVESYNIPVPPAPYPTQSNSSNLGDTVLATVARADAMLANKQAREARINSIIICMYDLGFELLTQEELKMFYPDVVPIINNFFPAAETMD